MSTGCWQGRRIAITGANGSLGRALIRVLHQRGAGILALTSSAEPLVERDRTGQAIPLEQVVWRCGAEAELATVLATADVLVLNHGVNVHGERSAAATGLSLEVNALSSWRLLELFAGLPDAEPSGLREAAAERSPREVWVNTSEAEIQPALSPLYEISKRLLGQLVSLRTLDLAGPGLRIRRLVLGPFRSALNPIGVMGADFVAREIVRQAGWNLGLVIVTPNPFTYVLMPLTTLSRWLYYRLITRGS